MTDRPTHSVRLASYYKGYIQYSTVTYNIYPCLQRVQVTKLFVFSFALPKNRRTKAKQQQQQRTKAAWFFFWVVFYYVRACVRATINDTTKTTTTSQQQEPKKKSRAKRASVKHSVRESKATGGSSVVRNKTRHETCHAHAVNRLGGVRMKKISVHPFPSFKLTAAAWPTSSSSKPPGSVGH
jgi:hypothetical protein